MKRKTEKEKMSECHLCLLGLIALSSLLTGTSGVNDAHVFISSGENVRLPCNNALHDCTSTTWNYNRFRNSGTVELIAGGKKKNTERQERLSLGSKCSLNVNNISKEDYGFYSCRQLVNDKQQEPDAHVHLHVLHVSQTEISAGLSVTLFCQLYSYPRVSCEDLIRSERIELFWVNQAGVKLMTDSRYQISSSSDHCLITLNITLLNEDHNREWRCNVTQRDQVKASITYTVKSSDMITFPAEAEVRRTAGLLFRVMVIIVEFAVFAAPTVILLQIICARRAGRKDSQHPEETEINTILE
uniref:Ig-like domain-containing protein n=1 Tax=Cyprinus carpio carpio TaxID=630221 RepID=A0A9J8BLT0_CYPCA